MGQRQVTWARVKELLDGLMARWEQRHGRKAFLKEIHGGTFGWETLQQLAECSSYGKRLIEPGIPGRRTYLVRFLTTAVDGMPRMPVNTPFLTSEEIDEIVMWIDSGMPE